MTTQDGTQHWWRCLQYTVDTHHCVVQHAQSVFIDCQPHLVLLNRGGRDGLWTGQTKTGRDAGVAYSGNIQTSSLGLPHSLKLVRPVFESSTSKGHTEWEVMHDKEGKERNRKMWCHAECSITCVYLGTEELGSKQGPLSSHGQVDPHTLGCTAPT